MPKRILYISAGSAIILAVLLTKGLPVAMLIRAIPLALVAMAGSALIWSGVKKV